MVRNWESASIGMSLVLAVVVLGLYAYPRAHSSPTYRLANGIKVTPLEVQPDDVAKVLDVKIWEFDASMPNVREKDQA